MKKLLIVLSLFLLSACVNTATETPETPTEPEPQAQAEPTFELTNQYLSATEWGPEANAAGVYLTFSEDGTYVLGLRGEGDGPTVGNYEINGDMIRLIPTKGPIGFEEQPESTYYFQRSDESVFYTEYLELKSDNDWNGKKLWNRGADTPSGVTRVVDGAEVITIETTKYLKPNTKFRANPTAESVHYIAKAIGGIQADHTTADWKEYYKGVLARTTSKSTLDGETDYWYLVHAQLGWYDYMVPSNDPESFVGSLSRNTFWVHGSEF